MTTVFGGRRSAERPLPGRAGFVISDIVLTRPGVDASNPRGVRRAISSPCWPVEIAGLADRGRGCEDRKTRRIAEFRRDLGVAVQDVATRSGRG